MPTLSRKKPKAHEEGKQLVDRPREPPWTYFCDFQDISHVVLKECHVSIHLQDNQCLVKFGLLQPSGWVGMALAYSTSLTSSRPAGAEPAFPCYGPVLCGTAGWLLPLDR
jgi:hypothetical protein